MCNAILLQDNTPCPNTALHNLVKPFLVITITVSKKFTFYVHDAGVIIFFLRQKFVTQGFKNISSWQTYNNCYCSHEKASQCEFLNMCRILFQANANQRDASLVAISVFFLRQNGCTWSGKQTAPLRYLVHPYKCTSFQNVRPLQFLCVIVRRHGQNISLSLSHYMFN